jgi:hypothetical protein
VSSDGIKQQGKTKLIFLNACFADKAADMLKTAAESVIGIGSWIDDIPAIAAAIRFYTNLAEGRSVQEAYDVVRQFLGESAEITLKWREGCDPDSIVFT